MKKMLSLLLALALVFSLAACGSTGEPTPAEPDPPAAEVPAYTELYPELYADDSLRGTVDVDNAVYLTFDDGPIPEVTPWVLELLDKHNIKATFFMVGDNIRKHPDVFRMVVERGHRIGNHTFNHIRGFEYLSSNYLANTDKANEMMKTDLFRPPHGHMRWMQYMTLKRHYKIIMWDLVTRDYSKKLRPPQVLANVMRYARNGSIITFHDSLKSWNNGNLQYALPRAIDFLKEEGYEFRLL